MDRHLPAAHACSRGGSRAISRIREALASLARNRCRAAALASFPESSRENIFLNRSPGPMRKEGNRGEVLVLPAPKASHRRGKDGKPIEAECRYAAAFRMSAAFS